MDAEEATALSSLPKHGRAPRTTLKTYALISWQVAKDPRLTACDLKEKLTSDAP